MDQQSVSVQSVVERVEAPFPGLLEPHRDLLSTGGVREPRGVHGQVLWRRFLPGKEFVHSVKELSVNPPQGLVERGVAWRALGRLDVLAPNDLGVRKGVMKMYEMEEMPTPTQVKTLTEKWHPLETVGTVLAWRVLESEYVAIGPISPVHR